jgi:hypothetical protein
VASVEAVVLVCWSCLLVVVISLGGNGIGDHGAVAIRAGLHGLSLLTSLEYVMQAWVMCMVGRRQARCCDGGG